MLFTLFYYVLYAVPLCALAAAFGLFFSGRGTGLKARLKAGRKGMPAGFLAALIIAVLYFGFYVGFQYLNSRLSASTVISLNYKEASKGLNPNKTRFNTYDILSDEVLGEVLERGGYDGLTVEELRGFLSVTPLEAGETISSETYYVSTEYVLRYHAGLKEFRMDGKKVVDLVAQVYHEQFLEAYSRKTDVLDVDFSDVDEAEYLDKPRILDAKASEIRDYMSICRREYGSFRSSSGDSFGSVDERANSFKNVTLERLESYILANGMANNKGQYISRLNYENQIKNLSYMKHLAAYRVRLDAIDQYERDMASIVLVPTRDENGEFYMGRTKIGVDNFAIEAEMYMQTAAERQADIETNNYKISRLLEAETGDVASVERLVEAAKQELSDIAASARNLLAEYDESNSSTSLLITPRGRETGQIFGFKGAGKSAAILFLSLTAVFLLRPQKGRGNQKKLPIFRLPAVRTAKKRAGGM